MALAWSSLLSGSGGEFLKYEPDQAVEVYYHGMWLNAVVIDATPLKSRNKFKKSYLYQVTSTEPNHKIHHVRETDIRPPMMYPTRKSVWAIQYRPHVNFGPNDWRVHHTSFKREVWNHSLRVVLNLVKRHYKQYSGEQDKFRLYNYQTREEIPMAGICD